jgi:hypothetical protein
VRNGPSQAALTNMALMTDRSMDARDFNKLAIRIGFREFRAASPKCEEELDAAALALRRA